jgi:hypothetical protein
VVLGGWLRDLTDAGRLEEPLTAIAIDGKWLRGVLDGQVKLFAAMLHEERPSSPSTVSRTRPPRRRRSGNCWTPWT